MGGRLDSLVKNSKNSFSKKFWTWANIIVWTAFLALIIATAYSNWHYPHGPVTYTGELLCPEQGGQCREKSVEDTRKLDIPEWAKFVRTGESSFFIIVLGAAGIYVAYKREGGEKNTDEDMFDRFGK